MKVAGSVLGGTGLRSGIIHSVGDGGIGAVKIGHDIRGTVEGAGRVFAEGGAADERAAHGVIGGSVTGTDSLVDPFAFVSQEIGSFKVAGTAIPLDPGRQNDSEIPISLDFGAGSDVVLNEA